jgi:hypothetical protein
MGSKSAHRTVAPARSAAITQGRTFASWSSLLTTTSSPDVQRRHAPPEHDAGRIGAEEVGQRRASIAHDVVGVELRGRDVAAIRQRADQCAVHRVRHNVWRLSPARSVEVRCAAVESGEPGAHRGDVEHFEIVHAMPASLKGTAAPSALRL